MTERSGEGMPTKKKLIEVALPLEVINQGSKPETENPFLKGHPRAIHNWWARTPLSICRAMLFAQMIDDPASSLPTAEAIKERSRLLRIVERLATWSATNDEATLAAARTEIVRQFGESIPQFWDMFGGRGSIPLEAQRLGLEVTASDVNPVPVLINKALLEIPSRFQAVRSINPDNRSRLLDGTRTGLPSLAHDVSYYGKLVTSTAQARLNALFPPCPVTDSLVSRTPYLQPYLGHRLPVIASLWVRTIRCPNPACRARAPMVCSFWLAKKDKRRFHAVPVVSNTSRIVSFNIAQNGDVHAPTSTRTYAVCIFCDRRIRKNELRDVAMEFGIAEIPFVTVCEGGSERLYLPADLAQTPATPSFDVDFLKQPITNDRRWFSPPLYGMTEFYDLFTPRQRYALAVLGACP